METSKLENNLPLMVLSSPDTFHGVMIEHSMGGMGATGRLELE